MTPEEVARFVLSDCRDPVLLEKQVREDSAALIEALKDPIFKARWEAGLREWADRIDAEVLSAVYSSAFPSPTE